MKVVHYNDETREFDTYEWSTLRVEIDTEEGPVVLRVIDKPYEDTPKVMIDTGPDRDGLGLRVLLDEIDVEDLDAIG